MAAGTVGGVAAATIDISVIVCTYNPGSELTELLDSVLEQETHGTFTYELLVVDNNSTDGACELVAGYAAPHAGRIRLIRESKQGKSHALNTGVEQARGGLCFILDQDERLPQGYLQRLYETMRDHPQATFVGGKVQPAEGIELPDWLDRRHWSAIAMCDYGAEPLYTDASRNLTLLAGCFRKADMQAVGGYTPSLGISPGMIGSVEDADLYARLYRAGRKGFYTPDLVLSHKIDTSRLEKRYHRRWHFGHGRYFSLMRDPDFERSRTHVLGVPLHVFGQIVRNAGAWTGARLRGRAEDAFFCELQVRFCCGFIYQRVFKRNSGSAQS